MIYNRFAQTRKLPPTHDDTTGMRTILQA